MTMTIAPPNSHTDNTDRDTLSTMWPWMKEAKCHIDTPIDPVDEHDTRATVKSLVSKHRASLDRMKQSLLNNTLYQPMKHDDLWLLRFLLSQGKEDKALEAAESTLQFRQEHNLDEYDLRGVHVTSKDIRDNLDKLPPFAEAAAKMMDCYDSPQVMIYSIPDTKRGVIGFLQIAGRNQHKMAEQLKEEDYFGAHLFFTEWKFQWMDYLTRTTGRLTKYLSIADFHGVHRKMIHKESKKKDSQAAKVMEDKYPQLLGSMIIVNAPGWMSIVFALLKPFAPKRLLEKVDVIQPVKHHKDLLKLLKYCSIEHLPERYGGKLEGWPPHSFLPNVQ